MSADYFRTMGIPLLRGRASPIATTGASAPVVIVSQSFARRHFPAADPIGRRVQLRERAPMTCCSAAGPVEGVWREIVGVVADVRQANLDEAAGDDASTGPYTQIVEHDMYVMVRARSAADAARLAAELGPQLLAVDPAQGLGSRSVRCRTSSTDRSRSGEALRPDPARQLRRACRCCSPPSAPTA